MPTVIADVSPVPSTAINRPRRVKAKSVSTIRSCLDEYYAYLDKAYDKIDTKNKLKRGITRFVDLVGNLPLQKVEPLTIYSFMDQQETPYNRFREASAGLVYALVQKQSVKAHYSCNRGTR